ncbi:prominin-like protein isoform X3 [Anoplophora glabripennis]|uniref:prominin-like protein isoform X3 n=1 Tax=Anoplophora glabripennis TaxID=217634 RepID=UPI0008755A50|nr:prominin-like protein isoform X3 [Anoplophora glabripennis]
MVAMRTPQRARGVSDALTTKNGRLRSNLACLAATCAILLATVAVSDGGFANSIDRITKNLDVALQDLMDDLPKYSNFTESREYVSAATFNPVGMAGLYNITGKFMDLVLEPDFLMDGLVTVKNGNINFQTDAQISEILKYYWGVLLVVAILVFLAILIPTCGLFFCCCRCCGNCGARSQPCDKKRDLCKKILQGTLLIILGTALLFCVVCAFSSNQQLQDGVDGLPKHLQNARLDTDTYLDSTKDQARHLLVTNYQEFSEVFSNTMNKSSEYVMDQLKIWSNATAMMDLYAFVRNMPVIQKSLETLKTDTNTLRASASQLNDAMRKVKRDLLITLEKCNIVECKNIKSNISQLQTNIDFNRLPDVSPTINRINELNLTQIESAAKEGHEKLRNIEQQISERLDDTLSSAKEKVNEAGVTIKNNLDNITSVISDVQDQIGGSIDPVIRDLNNYIRDYGQYRYYGGLAISCILLLVTICIALGLICGICGKRPDRYNDNCCNKGAGSQFLICAVMLMFIFGLVLAAVTLLMFGTGLSSDRVVCYPLRNPGDSKIMNLLDEYLTQVSSLKDFSFKTSLINCYQNESIYNVLNLRSQFDVDTISNKFDISNFLDQMYSHLNGILDEDFEILSPENLRTLEDLKDFDPSINFDQFQDELKQNFTNLSLNEISKKLGELVVNIQDQGDLDDVKTEVQLSILHINTYDEKLLQPMKELANKVIDISKQLDTDLKMNSSSFSEAIDKLLNEIQEAQTVLRKEGADILQKVAKEFGNMVLNQVDSFLDRVTYVIKEEFGQCGPMNAAINATLTAACDKIILPWNGFWLSLLLSLVLFIPTIIVSVKLASLYQKYKQFGGQYVETRGGKRGKKKGKKSKYYEDRPQNMGGDVVSREHATGSHPPDTRYSDMAPKHWEEFPNGGPPQYQRAPTEYERPPPYYYPGTGDQ